MKKETKKYDIGYDVVRIISMALIIAIHVSALWVTKYGQISRFDWNISNFIDAFSRMAVDIFIILSGALILSKDYGIKNFYFKRLRKIVIPFIFWTLFYTFWGKYFKEYNISVKTTLLKSYNQPVYYHLWFLYAIIALYLVTPILKIILNHISNKILFIICIIWLIILTPNFLNKFGILNNKLPMIKWSYTSFDYILEYGAYYILGYVLINYLRNLTKRKIITYGVITFISNFIIFIGTTYLSNRNNLFDGRLYYSPSIFVAISSIAGYIFIYGFSGMFYEKFKIHKKLICTISYCSFGVYLIHICIMEILIKNNMVKKVLFSIAPIISLPILFIFVSTISIVIVNYFRKVVIIKNIF